MPPSPSGSAAVVGHFSDLLESPRPADEGNHEDSDSSIVQNTQSADEVSRAASLYAPSIHTVHDVSLTIDDKKLLLRPAGDKKPIIAEERLLYSSMSPADKIDEEKSVREEIEEEDKRFVGKSDFAPELKHIQIDPAPEILYGRESGWAAVARSIRDIDEQKIKDYKEDIDTILVFVSIRLR